MLVHAPMHTHITRRGSATFAEDTLNAPHGMAWHGMAWHGMAWHGMAVVDHNVPRSLDACARVRAHACALQERHAAHVLRRRPSVVLFNPPL
jgi:hypothetical protein